MLSTSSAVETSPGGYTFEELETRILQLEQQVAAEKTALDNVEADAADPVGVFSILSLTNYFQDAASNIVSNFSALQSLVRNGNSVDVANDLTVGGKLWIPTSAEAVMGIEDIETRVFQRVGEFDFHTTIEGSAMYEGQNLPAQTAILQSQHDTLFNDAFNYRVWDDYTDTGNRVSMVIPPGKYFYHVHLTAHGFQRIQRFTCIVKCRAVSDDSLTYETEHIQYRPNVGSTNENMSGIGIPSTFFRAVTQDEHIDLYMDTRLAPYHQGGAGSSSRVTATVRVTRIAPI